MREGGSRMRRVAELQKDPKLMVISMLDDASKMYKGRKVAFK